MSIKITEAQLKRMRENGIEGLEPAPPVMKRKRERGLERTFMTYWKWAGGGDDDWETDYKFDLPNSKMEYDFAMPALRIAVEVNGGQNRGGKSGHGNWEGLERDAVKINRSLVLGWRLWILTTSMVNPRWVGEVYQYVKEQREAAHGHNGSHLP